MAEASFRHQVPSSGPRFAPYFAKRQMAGRASCSLFESSFAKAASLLPGLGRVNAKDLLASRANFVQAKLFARLGRTRWVGCGGSRFPASHHFLLERADGNLE